MVDNMVDKFGAHLSTMLDGANLRLDVVSSRRVRIDCRSQFDVERHLEELNRATMTLARLDTAIKGSVARLFITLQRINFNNLLEIVYIAVR